jgi:hypothetical protein
LRGWFGCEFIVNGRNVLLEDSGSDGGGCKAMRVCLARRRRKRERYDGRLTIMIKIGRRQLRKDGGGKSHGCLSANLFIAKALS